MVSKSLDFGGRKQSKNKKNSVHNHQGDEDSAKNHMMSIDSLRDPISNTESHFANKPQLHTESSLAIQGTKDLSSQRTTELKHYNLNQHFQS